MSTRVAVDTGGTFIDVLVLDEDTGDVSVAKVPSTPEDPMRAVMNGVAAAGVDLHAVGLFSHGTTVATNALLTRRLPPAAMVTTKGFRDVIEIRRGTREDLWDAYDDVAPPYIRRRDRLEVAERIDFGGTVLEPLDEDAARAVAARLRAKGIEAVAVCFINSYANPANEDRMKEILLEELPGVHVTTSSEVLPEIFEHERFSTTVTNAVLTPLVGGYVERLGETLEREGYSGDVLLLHSGGGVMTPAMVRQYAVRLAGSGIAAGAIAARQLAMLCGHRNAIGLDMGGTSTDISLVSDGEMRVTREWSVEYGYPICFPSIEILTIGAGGGSEAWIDDAGSLRNGPQSAGADPGPACYGQGGDEPTNTDANVVLGRLGTELLGGGMPIDGEAARRAVAEKVAAQLDMDETSAARAILEVANANMADAVRLISIRRGYDPREFALVVFGGAGPLHGAELARELSIPTVIVPPHPGVTSALGCLLVDIRHDLSRMYLRRADEADPEEVEAAFAELEEEARGLLRAEGVDERDISLERLISMRYAGQWRSLTVAVDAPIADLREPVARFHSEHEREHSYRRDETPVELYQLQLRALGVTPKPELPHQEPEPHEPEPHGERLVSFDADPVPTPVYRRDELRAGARFEGPAIVEQLDSTVLVPPGVRAEVDEWLMIRMEVFE